MPTEINSFPITGSTINERTVNTELQDSDLFITRQDGLDKQMTGIVSKRGHGGIIPWTTSFPFLGGGYTDRLGILYRAKQDNTNQDPNLDITNVYWDRVPNTEVPFKKNLLINGNFDVWQRGSTFIAINQEYTSDRWLLSNTTVADVSRGVFTLGQTDVPSNPDYYARIVTPLTSGASNYISLQQKILKVSGTAGETVTLSFYAKADASKNIATEFIQEFGTGGSPSSSVVSLGVTTHPLTTGWTKHTVTVSIPSLSGKTLGTNFDDSLSVIFWLTAGSDFDSRNNTLGHQVGTFDLSQVQLEINNIATNFEQRSFLQELDFCQDYFRKSYEYAHTPGFASPLGQRLYTAASTAQRAFSFDFTRMRTRPAIIFYSPTTGTSGQIHNISATGDATASAIDISETSFSVEKASSHNDTNVYAFHYTANAEL